MDIATGTINESVILTASDGADDDFFGWSVSLSGNIGLVGAFGDNGNGFQSGSAYVFRDLDTAAGNIKESVKLTASDADAFYLFGRTGSAYTGTVSSVTTLDIGNSSAIVDGISFESRSDWIIGETTNGNMVTLTADDSANITETGMFVLIGATAGSNDNRLVIDGSIEANNVFIGSSFNSGNELVLSAIADNMISTITLFGNNFLTLEGELTSFALLDAELGTTQLLVASGDTLELITADNFHTRLQTTFNSATGFTTFTFEADPHVGTVTPDMFTVFRGIQLSGVITDFESSDDVRAIYNPGFILTNAEAPVWLIFDGVAPAANQFFFESQAGTPGLTYTMEAFNWGGASYDVIANQDESFNTDVVTTFGLTADHIDVGGEVRSRVGWRQTGFIINFPWEVRVDQVAWLQ